MSNPPKHGFSVKEAQQCTSLSRATLYRLHDEGRLRFVKIGRRVVIPASELLRLVEHGEGDRLVTKTQSDHSTGDVGSTAA